VLYSGLDVDPLLQYAIAIEIMKPYANYVDLMTNYGHLNEVKVKVGDRVKRGDVIGLSGKVDPAIIEAALLPYIPDGEHLHFEADIGTAPIKPATGLPAKGYYTDPYRNIVPYNFTFSDGGNSTVGLWTKDNDPQFP
jgi:hypothetical protein